MSTVSIVGGAPSGSGSSVVAPPGNRSGSAAGSIDVEEAGAPVVTAATAFHTTGATIPDAGDGVVNIAVTGSGGGGITVDENGAPIVADATKLNFVGATVTDAGGGEATVTVTAGNFPDITDTAGVSVVVAATTDGLIVNAPAATNPGLTVQYADSESEGDALLSAFSGFGGGLAVSKDSSSGGFGYNVVTIVELILAGNLALGSVGAIGTSGQTGTVNDFQVGPTGPLVFDAGSAGLTVTGMVPVNGFAQPIYGVGAVRIILNVGAGSVTLENQNAGSAAENRFTLPNAASVVIPPGGGVLLYYSPPSSSIAASTWLLLAKSF